LGVLQAQRADELKSIFAALAMATAATMWCIVDASSRGSYYRHSYRWITMITWPIAVPVYLIYSRGARGALLALFGLVGLLLSQLLGYAAGDVLFGGR
jgi:roadblock/LC7 domain-containing protein